MRRAIACLAVAGLATAGCGEPETEALKRKRASPTPAQTVSARPYPGARVRDGLRVRGVTRPPGQGRWLWEVRSPNGRWRLLQWSGECEVPSALVARRGQRRARELAPGLASSALGWTPDDRVLVYVPDAGACGSGDPSAGLLVVDPATGDREQLEPPSGPAPPLPWSERPRRITAW